MKLQSEKVKKQQPIFFFGHIRSTLCKCNYDLYRLRQKSTLIFLCHFAALHTLTHSIKLHKLILMLIIMKHERLSIQTHRQPLAQIQFNKEQIALIYNNSKYKPITHSKRAVCILHQILSCNHFPVSKQPLFIHIFLDADVLCIIR